MPNRRRTRPAPVQFPLFPESVALIRIRPDRNDWRFYHLEVWPDLFGRAPLVRHWGRIGIEGRRRLDPHSDAGAAINALAALAWQKRRRGDDSQAEWCRMRGVAVLGRGATSLHTHGPASDAARTTRPRRDSGVVPPPDAPENKVIHKIGELSRGVCSRTLIVDSKGGEARIAPALDAIDR